MNVTRVYIGHSYLKMLHLLVILLTLITTNAFTFPYVQEGCPYQKGDTVNNGHCLWFYGCKSNGYPWTTGEVYYAPTKHVPDMKCGHEQCWTDGILCDAPKPFKYPHTEDLKGTETDFAAFMTYVKEIKEISKSLDFWKQVGLILECAFQKLSVLGGAEDKGTSTESCNELAGKYEKHVNPSVGGTPTIVYGVFPWYTNKMSTERKFDLGITHWMGSACKRYMDSTRINEKELWPKHATKLGFEQSVAISFEMEAALGKVAEVAASVQWSMTTQYFIYQTASCVNVGSGKKCKWRCGWERSYDFGNNKRLGSGSKPNLLASMGVTLDTGFISGWNPTGKSWGGLSKGMGTSIGLYGKLNMANIKQPYLKSAFKAWGAYRDTYKAVKGANLEPGAPPMFDIEASVDIHIGFEAGWAGPTTENPDITPSGLPFKNCVSDGDGPHACCAAQSLLDPGCNTNDDAFTWYVGNNVPVWMLAGICSVCNALEDGPAPPSLHLGPRDFETLLVGIGTEAVMPDKYLFKKFKALYEAWKAGGGGGNFGEAGIQISQQITNGYAFIDYLDADEFDDGSGKQKCISPRAPAPTMSIYEHSTKCDICPLGYEEKIVNFTTGIPHLAPTIAKTLLNDAGEKVKNFDECALLCASSKQKYSLVKSGETCGSFHYPFTSASTIEKCADECLSRPKCNFFNWGEAEAHCSIPMDAHDRLCTGNEWTDPSTWSVPVDNLAFYELIPDCKTFAYNESAETCHQLDNINQADLLANLVSGNIKAFSGTECDECAYGKYQDVQGSGCTECPIGFMGSSNRIIEDLKCKPVLPDNCLGANVSLPVCQNVTFNLLAVNLTLEECEEKCGKDLSFQTLQPGTHCQGERIQLDIDDAYDNINKCADACLAQEGCLYFSYQEHNFIFNGTTGRKVPITDNSAYEYSTTKCYHEKTETPWCIEGFKKWHPGSSAANKQERSSGRLWSFNMLGPGGCDEFTYDHVNKKCYRGDYPCDSTHSEDDAQSFVSTYETSKIWAKTKTDWETVTFPDENWRDECDVCAKGKYQDQVGQVSCIACPAGWYQDETGKSNCTACDTGQYSATMSPNCNTTIFLQDSEKSTTKSGFYVTKKPFGVEAIRVRAGTTQYCKSSTPDTTATTLKNATTLKKCADKCATTTNCTHIQFKLTSNEIGSGTCTFLTPKKLVTRTAAAINYRCSHNWQTSFMVNNNLLLYDQTRASCSLHCQEFKEGCQYYAFWDGGIPDEYYYDSTRGTCELYTKGQCADMAEDKKYTCRHASLNTTLSSVYTTALDCDFAIRDGNFGFTPSKYFIYFHQTCIAIAEGDCKSWIPHAVHDMYESVLIHDSGNAIYDVNKDVNKDVESCDYTDSIYNVFNWPKLIGVDRKCTSAATTIKVVPFTFTLEGCAEACQVLEKCNFFMFSSDSIATMSDCKGFETCGSNTDVVGYNLYDARAYEEYVRYTTKSHNRQIIATDSSCWTPIYFNDTGFYSVGNYPDQLWSCTQFGGNGRLVRRGPYVGTYNSHGLENNCKRGYNSNTSIDNTNGKWGNETQTAFWFGQQLRKRLKENSTSLTLEDCSDKCQEDSACEYFTHDGTYKCIIHGNDCAELVSQSDMTVYGKTNGIDAYGYLLPAASLIRTRNTIFKHCPLGTSSSDVEYRNSNTCGDSGWSNIASPDDCEAKALSLGLSDLTDFGWLSSEEISLGRSFEFNEEFNADKPPGCYVNNSGYKLMFNHYDQPKVPPINCTTEDVCICIKTCKLCNKGKYGANPGICEDCPFGQFNPLKGQTECTECDTGLYNDETGRASSSDCKECRAGIAAVTGSRICTPCDDGYVAATERNGTDRPGTVCIGCSKGTYQPAAQEINDRDAIQTAIKQSEYKTDDQCLAIKLHDTNTGCLYVDYGSVQTLRECSDKCQKDSTCKYFTYKMNGGGCGSCETNSPLSTIDGWNVYKKEPDEYINTRFENCQFLGSHMESKYATEVLKHDSCVTTEVVCPPDEKMGAHVGCCLSPKPCGTRLVKLKYSDPPPKTITAGSWKSISIQRDTFGFQSRDEFDEQTVSYLCRGGPHVDTTKGVLRTTDYINPLLTKIKDKLTKVKEFMLNIQIFYIDIAEFMHVNVTTKKYTYPTIQGMHERRQSSIFLENANVWSTDKSKKVTDCTNGGVTQAVPYRLYEDECKSSTMNTTTKECTGTGSSYESPTKQCVRPSPNGCSGEHSYLRTAAEYNAPSGFFDLQLFATDLRLRNAPKLKCDGTANELLYDSSSEECQQRCAFRPNCISFEYSDVGCEGKYLVDASEIDCGTSTPDQDTTCSFRESDRTKGCKWYTGHTGWHGSLMVSSAAGAPVPIEYTASGGCLIQEAMRKPTDRAECSSDCRIAGEAKCKYYIWVQDTKDCYFMNENKNNGFSVDGLLDIECNVIANVQDRSSVWEVNGVCVGYKDGEGICHRELPTECASRKTIPRKCYPNVANTCKDGWLPGHNNIDWLNKADGYMEFCKHNPWSTVDARANQYCCMADVRTSGSYTTIQASVQTCRQSYGLNYEPPQDVWIDASGGWYPLSGTEIRNLGLEESSPTNLEKLPNNYTISSRNDSCQYCRDTESIMYRIGGPYTRHRHWSCGPYVTLDSWRNTTEFAELISSYNNTAWNFEWITDTTAKCLKNTFFPNQKCANGKPLGTVSTMLECLNKCRNTSACTSFTYNSDTKDCEECEATTYYDIQRNPVEYIIFNGGGLVHLVRYEIEPCTDLSNDIGKLLIKNNLDTRNFSESESSSRRQKMNDIYNRNLQKCARLCEKSDQCNKYFSFNVKESVDWSDESGASPLWSCTSALTNVPLGTEMPDCLNPWKVGDNPSRYGVFKEDTYDYASNYQFFSINNVEPKSLRCQGEPPPGKNHCPSSARDVATYNCAQPVYNLPKVRQCPNGSRMTNTGQCTDGQVIKPSEDAYCSPTLGNTLGTGSFQPDPKSVEWNYFQDTPWNIPYMPSYVTSCTHHGEPYVMSDPEEPHKPYNWNLGLHQLHPPPTSWCRNTLQYNNGSGGNAYCTHNGTKYDFDYGGIADATCKKTTANYADECVSVGCRIHEIITNLESGFESGQPIFSYTETAVINKLNNVRGLVTAAPIIDKVRTLPRPSKTNDGDSWLGEEYKWFINSTNGTIDDNIANSMNIVISELLKSVDDARQKIEYSRDSRKDQYNYHEKGCFAFIDIETNDTIVFYNQVEKTKRADVKSTSTTFQKYDCKEASLHLLSKSNLTYRECAALSSGIGWNTSTGQYMYNLNPLSDFFTYNNNSGQCQLQSGLCEPTRLYKNRECTGEQINLDMDVSLQECDNLCADRQGCQYFRYRTYGGECWWQKTCSWYNNNEDKRHIIDGYTCTQPGSTYNTTSDSMESQYPYNAKRERCELKCQETSSCSYYSYNENTFKCILETECATLDEWTSQNPHHGYKCAKEHGTWNYTTKDHNWVFGIPFHTVEGVTAMECDAQCASNAPEPNQKYYFDYVRASMACDCHTDATCKIYTSGHPGWDLYQGGMISAPGYEFWQTKVFYKPGSDVYETNRQLVTEEQYVYNTNQRELRVRPVDNTSVVRYCSDPVLIPMPCANCGDAKYSERDIGSTTCHHCGVGTYNFGQFLGGSCNACPQDSLGGPMISNTFIRCFGNCTPGWGSSDQSLTGWDTTTPNNATIGSATCKVCRNGTYQATWGKKSCKNCPLGWSTDNQNEAHNCTACANGQYQDELGQPSCKADCGPGFYINSDKTACLGCIAGQYQNNSNQDNCIDCPGGRYQDELKGPSCKDDCFAGFYINSDKTACLGCIAGQYQNNSNQDNCIDCPVGTIAKQAEQSKCGPCGTGKYTDKTGTGKLNSECKECPTGTYQNEPHNKSSCIDCPKGYAQPNVGNSNCTICEYLSYTGLTKQVKCKVCTRGQYYSDNVKCTSCARGKYGSTRGMYFEKGTRCSTLETIRPTLEDTAIQMNQCKAAAISMVRSGSLDGLEPAPRRIGTTYKSNGKWITNLTAGWIPKCLKNTFFPNQQCANGNPLGTFSTLQKCLNECRNTIACTSFTYNSHTTNCEECEADTYTTGGGYLVRYEIEPCTPALIPYGCSYQVLTSNLSNTSINVDLSYNPYNYQGSSTTNTQCDGNHHRCLCSLGPNSFAAYRANESHCEECEAGTYTDVPGYADNLGLGVCKDCPIGFWEENTSSISCTACAAGTQGTGVANKINSCNNCTTGMYSDKQFQPWQVVVDTWNTPRKHNWMAGTPFDKLIDDTIGKVWLSPFMTEFTDLWCSECVNINNDGTIAQVRGNISLVGGEWISIAGQVFRVSASFNNTHANGITTINLADVWADKKGYYNNPASNLDLYGLDTYIGHCTGYQSTPNEITLNVTRGHKVLNIGDYISIGGALVGEEFRVTNVTQVAQDVAQVYLNSNYSGKTWNSMLSESFDVCDNRYNPIDVLPYCTSSNETAWGKPVPCYLMVSGGAGECTVCPKGYYEGKEGQGSCTSCEPGTYNDQTGQTSQSDCKDCAAGTYADKPGLPLCTDCEKGQYQDQDGESDCNNCTVGKYNDEQGQSACRDCAAGTYGDKPGLPLCTDCVQGRYQELNAQSDCDNCTVGKYGRIVEQSGSFINSPSECAQGKEITTAALCAAVAWNLERTGFGDMLPIIVVSYDDIQNGQDSYPKWCTLQKMTYMTGGASVTSWYPAFSEHTTTSELRGVGDQYLCRSKYVKESRACAQCDAGQYAATEGSTTCEACPSGWFQDDIGQQKCTSCGKGKKMVNKYTYERTIVQYEEGIYNEAGECTAGCYGRFVPKVETVEVRTHCSTCPEGKYQNQIGQSSCKTCSVDWGWIWHGPSICTPTVSCPDNGFPITQTCLCGSKHTGTVLYNDFWREHHNTSIDFDTASTFCRNNVPVSITNCSHTNMTTENVNACQCGNVYCDKAGLYCNSTSSKCQRHKPCQVNSTNNTETCQCEYNTCYAKDSKLAVESLKLGLYCTDGKCGFPPCEVNSAFGNTETCQCGPNTCNATSGLYCTAGRDCTPPPCKTDGKFTGKCQCGTNICTPGDSPMLCNGTTSTCSYPACVVNSTVFTRNKCKCGSVACEPSQSCDGAKCTYKDCTHKYGLKVNSNECNCGTIKCEENELCYTKDGVGTCRTSGEGMYGYELKTDGYCNTTLTKPQCKTAAERMSLPLSFPNLYGGTPGVPCDADGYGPNRTKTDEECRCVVPIQSASECQKYFDDHRHELPNQYSQPSFSTNVFHDVTSGCGVFFGNRVHWSPPNVANDSDTGSAYVVCNTVLVDTALPPGCIQSGDNVTYNNATSEQHCSEENPCICPIESQYTTQPCQNTNDTIKNSGTCQCGGDPLDGGTTCTPGTGLVCDGTTKLCRKRCPTGTARSNNDYCIPCNVGETSINEKCVTATVGECSVNTGDGIVWNTVALRDGIVWSDLCAAGKYASVSATSIRARVCTECPRGQYNDVTNKDKSCKTCTAGQYQNVAGLSSCKQCVPGKYGAQVQQANESACVDCGLGTYQNVAGLSSCKQCDGQSTRQTGQKNCNRCSGKWHNGSCVTCAAGKFHEDTETTGVCVDCPMGYYNQGENSHGCIECVCPIGSRTPNTGMNKNQNTCFNTATPPRVYTWKSGDVDGFSNLIEPAAVTGGNGEQIRFECIFCSRKFIVPGYSQYFEVHQQSYFYQNKTGQHTCEQCKKNPYDEGADWCIDTGYAAPDQSCFVNFAFASNGKSC